MAYHIMKLILRSEFRYTYYKTASAKKKKKKKKNCISCNKVSIARSGARVRR